MEQISTYEKFSLALTLGGAVAVAAVCFSLAFAGCSSSVDDPDVAGASSSSAGGGAGGESASSSSSNSTGGGVCVPWELGDDPNWQAIKDRCVDDGLPEPVCCNSPEEQPGCISTTYVDPDCGLVWCCP